MAFHNILDEISHGINNQNFNEVAIICFFKEESITKSPYGSTSNDDVFCIFVLTVV